MSERKDFIWKNLRKVALSGFSPIAPETNVCRLKLRDRCIQKGETSITRSLPSMTRTQWARGVARKSSCSRAPEF